MAIQSMTSIQMHVVIALECRTYPHGLAGRSIGADVASDIGNAHVCHINLLNSMAMQSRQRCSDDNGCDVFSTSTVIWMCHATPGQAHQDRQAMRRESVTLFSDILRKKRGLLSAYRGMSETVNGYSLKTDEYSGECSVIILCTSS